MRVALDRSDRKILIGAALGLIALTVFALLVSRPEKGGKIGYPSSYSAASDGAKAAYLLLDESDYDVRHWTSSPRELPVGQPGAVLVLAEPFSWPSEEDREAVKKFVNNGGRLLAVGNDYMGLFPESAAEYGGDVFSWTRYPAVLPSPLTRGIPQITMQPRLRWQTGKHPGQLPLYGDENGPVVVTYRYGQGEVIWWADPTPLTNAGLRESGNLELFLKSVGERGQVHVYWDEYFHGMRPGFWSYIERTPLPWAGLQIGVLVLFVLMTFARRSGPIRVPATEGRLSPLEFVDTIGGLYQRAHAGTAAVEIAYKRFRYLLARQLGIATTAKVRDVYELAKARVGADGNLLATLQQCERAIYDPDLARANGLRLVQELHRYSQALRLTPHQEI